ncbi:MAG: TIR domain-containing protein [Proteobacteria bacterium]|nr:TIR domain-containing protein [Pseudomonadota bacterium]MBU1583385.1 TIR domain-containing protein [Pseudomonadota bacterium]MBU2453658.1 TIR domain-containing protein [Pseudomonadota bacterium]MBU2629248.1 TIR domain-containing protein [Pseudomonadota bacterium]
MNNIFISYRREDSEGFARGLFQSLVSAFGQKQVFMDVEGISLGTDFVQAIDKSLEGCGALLVLIGKDWVNCTNTKGNRRLDDPKDFVRMEVVKALERQVRVIPVLVKGAGMPSPEDLPEDLQPVTRRQALELRNERWNQDVAHLISTLADLLGLERLDQQKPASPLPPAQMPVKKSRLPLTALAAVMVVCILAITGFFLMNQKPSPTPEPAKPMVQKQTVPDEPAPSSKNPVSPPAKKKTIAEPLPTVKPQPEPEPKKRLNLSGVWVDNNGLQVQIAHSGNQVVSQCNNPLTGEITKAIWQINGLQFAFTWSTNTGYQGYGEGIIAANAATVDFQFIENITGEQGYGRLYRLNH